MNWNKETGCSHPPGFTNPVEGQNGAADGGQTTHATNSFAADFMSVPFMPSGSGLFPHHDIQRNFQPYSFEGENGNNWLSDYMDLDLLADSSTDANLIDTTNGRNNTVGADYLMNPVSSSSTDYLNSQVQMNFMPPRNESTSGYPMKARGEEAKSSNISRPQMSRNFPPSLSPLANNFEAINKDVTFIPSDGNFLTLGVGGGTEIRPNSNFSSREIASKFEEAVPSRSNSSHVGQSPKYPFSHSRMPTCYEGGHIRGTNARPNSVPFPSSQNPHANAQPGFLPRSDNFVFDQNPHANALPFHRNFPVRPECGASSLLRPQPTKPKHFTSQSISNRQMGYHGNSYMHVLPESSARQFSERHRASPISHAQQGKLIPLAEGIRTQTGDVVPFSGSVQPVGNLAQQREGTSLEMRNIGSFPSRDLLIGDLAQQREGTSLEMRNIGSFPSRAPLVGTSHNVSSSRAFGLQTPRGSSFQSAGRGPFPKRLGVQPIDLSTARTASGNLHPAQYGPVDYSQNPLRPPSMIGSRPMHLAASYRPLAPPGQINPTANIDIRPRDSPIVSRPYLKRQATANSPIVHSSHRRKILPQPAIQHSIPSINIPAPIPETAYIPPEPLHIKWKGADEPPKPTGYKCLLCKRDLSFTAEGPVYQPAISPAVAVLPCGHTFHDLCLERITPEGHSKNPPCIPCAIGET